MDSPRTRWSDDRLDDLARELRHDNRELKDLIVAAQESITSMRDEEIRSLRYDANVGRSERYAAKIALLAAVTSGGASALLAFLAHH